MTGPPLGDARVTVARPRQQVRSFFFFLPETGVLCHQLSSEPVVGASPGWFCGRTTRPLASTRACVTRLCPPTGGAARMGVRRVVRALGYGARRW